MLRPTTASAVVDLRKKFLKSKIWMQVVAVKIGNVTRHDGSPVVEKIPQAKRFGCSRQGRPKEGGEKIPQDNPAEKIPQGMSAQTLTPTFPKKFGNVKPTEKIEKHPTKQTRRCFA